MLQITKFLCKNDVIGKHFTAPDTSQNFQQFFHDHQFKKYRVKRKPYPS